MLDVDDKTLVTAIGAAVARTVTIDQQRGSHHDHDREPGALRGSSQGRALVMKADRLLGQPSHDWIVALVEEGERRERAQREADASSH